MMVKKYFISLGGGAVGTYNYVLHNSIPVVSSASVTITPTSLDTGSDTTTCTQNYSRSLDDDGVQDCDAGHILAHRLGGPGNQPINIFPQVCRLFVGCYLIPSPNFDVLWSQDLSVNRGSYAQFEDKIYDCLSTGGASSANLAWSFTYATDTNTKPTGVSYTAVFTGGSCGTLSQAFTN